jgi:hypothetical protein
MTEETPPEVANLRAEETVDWLVALRDEEDDQKYDLEDGVVEWDNPARNPDSEDGDSDE